MENFPNISTLLEQRRETNPAKVFLLSEADGRSWTYSEFDTTVRRMANMLTSKGVGKGDVVSLLLQNSAEYIIAYFACFRAGAIAGPINSLLKPAEINWAITNSEATLVLAESGLAHAAFRNCPPNFPEIFILDNADHAATDFDGDSPLADISPCDEAILIHTSGTTGKPKGCLLTHGNLLANSRQITEWLGFEKDDRLLTIMPLFHMNAVTVTTMTALYCGGSTVISKKFSASRFWNVISSYEITSFGSVAAMLSMLLKMNQGPRINDVNANGSGGLDLNSQPSSLKFAMCGSAPVPAEVLRNFEDTFGCLVVEGYGLSESTCRSTFNPPNTSRRPGSCGMPIGNEMNVFDENDNEVAAGELGEIVLRGPNIFKGYFKDSAATQLAFTSGWFHTGDIGYRDIDGYYYIADRKSDMIIRGGENIYPREIDDLLYAHAAVAAAAVIGVPDDIYGDEVVAFVILKDGAAATESDLIEHCRQYLADYKCPKLVYFISDIPKGPTGKLLKRELAKLYFSETR